VILEKVFEIANPRLKGRKIKDIRVGLGLLAVELDNGLTGVTYVLSNEIKHSCGLLPEAGSLKGHSAEEIARWAVDGDNVISRAMGLAILNSAADFERLEEKNLPKDSDAVFAADIHPRDKIGIVGQIGPVISRLQDKDNELFVFEREEGNPMKGIYPESAQPDLLPQCQVVFITSSTLINQTLETLLSYCMDARDVVMVGSSTPIYPQAFEGSGVTILSGTRWLSENSDPILTGISQCAGIKQLMKYGRKISVRVK